MALSRGLSLGVLFKKVVENVCANTSRLSSSTCLISRNKSLHNIFKTHVFQIASLRTNSLQNITRQDPVPIEQDTHPEISKEDIQIAQDVISKVNKQIEEKSHGRLFAVVHVCGKQFKVTNEDLIIIEGYWPPEVGDELALEKVLLAGGSDFTLVGRPILSRELVSVKATVIEKTLSHIKTHFRKKRRKQYMRINFHRAPFTMLRINSVEINGLVKEKNHVNASDGRIF